MYHESFALPEAENRLWGEDSEGFDVPLWSCSKDPEVGMRLADKTKLTPAQEVTLFLKFNYARYRLHHLLATPGARDSIPLTEQVLKWRSRAETSRANLVRANIALVYAMVRRTSVAGVEFNDLVSEGSIALLRSVEKFDVSRGAKFSTYACRSILKAFGRLAKRTQRKRRNLAIQLSPNLEFYDPHVGKHEQRWKESLESLREILGQNLARLSEVEQVIVRERFALNGREKPLTLAQVAKIVGLTDERVRQLQIAALAKIRAALERDLPEPVRTAGP